MEAKNNTLELALCLMLTSYDNTLNAMLNTISQRNLVNEEMITFTFNTVIEDIGFTASIVNKLSQMDKEEKLRYIGIVAHKLQKTTSFLEGTLKQALDQSL